MSDSFVFHRVLRTDNDARALVAALKLNRKAMAEAGTPLQVTVTLYKAKRNDGQNALYWHTLGEIA
ncbi:hypothetical protein, partial [Proteus terrae]|uniref:hypothetical protein n=1 Tax=Proteus terrae TaxID=1574161 RepID=UPI00301DE4AE